jgi:RNA polymerase sigma factor (TIGR02999 family)
MAYGGEITALLNAWSRGDHAAADRLTPLIYEELRATARRLFRSEPDGHTLQPTALVHEAFARLVDVEITWADRAHFYALAARMMRRLLINQAQARRAAKRGGDAIRVTLIDDVAPASDVDADVLALSEALAKLEALDPPKAELIEMRYFGGLSIRELEAVTGRSSSSLGRDLRFARAWLKQQLSADA